MSYFFQFSVFFNLFLSLFTIFTYSVPSFVPLITSSLSTSQTFTSNNSHSYAIISSKLSLCRFPSYCKHLGFFFDHLSLSSIFFHHWFFLSYFSLTVFLVILVNIMTFIHLQFLFLYIILFIIFFIAFSSLPSCVLVAYITNTSYTFPNLYQQLSPSVSNKLFLPLF